MKRLIPLEVVARQFSLSVDYLRHIAADQGREPGARRYPAETHERFPQFFKDGNSRKWFTTEQTLNAHLRRRNQEWEPAL